MLEYNADPSVTTKFIKHGGAPSPWRAGSSSSSPISDVSVGEGERSSIIPAIPHVMPRNEVWHPCSPFFNNSIKFNFRNHVVVSGNCGVGSFGVLGRCSESRFCSESSFFCAAWPALRLFGLPKHVTSLDSSFSGAFLQ